MQTILARPELDSLWSSSQLASEFASVESWLFSMVRLVSDSAVSSQPVAVVPQAVLCDIGVSAADAAGTSDAAGISSVGIGHVSVCCTFMVLIRSTAGIAGRVRASLCGHASDAGVTGTNGV